MMIRFGFLVESSQVALNFEQSDSKLSNDLW